MTLPSFVLIGVPKAGTKSLYHYLRQHPQLALSDLQEINFLSYPGERMAAKQLPWMAFPITTLEQYARLFANAGDHVAVDLSASCFTSPVSVDRIRQFLPRAGLFALLRDPVERAYSAYLHRIRKGYETRPPQLALVPGERTVDLGFYGARLNEFVDAFGIHRLRVWLLDDIRRDAQATMGEIFAYLGVDPTWPVDVTAVRNKSSVPRSRSLHRLFLTYDRRRKLAGMLPEPIMKPVKWAWGLNQTVAPAMPQEVEERLRLLYADDRRRLQDMLQRDLAEWRTPVAERPVSERPTSEGL